MMLTTAKALKILRHVLGVMSCRVSPVSVNAKVRV